MVVATTGGSLRVVLATTAGSFWVVVVVTTAGSFRGRVDSFWGATILGTFRRPVRAGGQTILLDGATGEVAPLLRLITKPPPRRIWLFGHPITHLVQSPRTKVSPSSTDRKSVV